MKEKKLTISEVLMKRKAPIPTLLHFQNGSLAAVSKENTTYYQVEHKDTKTKEAVVVSSGHIYTGAINTTAAAEQLKDTYIVVRNKATNKLRILPIEQAHLNNTIYQKLDKERAQKTLSKEHAANALLKQFGGRKASRYVDNREQMKVNVDVVRDELESTLNETDVLDNSLEVNVNNEEYIQNITPNSNKEAKTVEEVYDLDDVIPSKLMDRLEEEAKVVYTTPLANLPIKSEYLLECIKSIQSKGTQSRSDFRDIKIIIYMDALHTLIATRKRSLKELELSGITEKVETDIRNRFADPNVTKSFTRTTYTCEKALAYFIVLALLISDKFEIDADIISKTLNISKKKIVDYAQIVHAKVKPRTSMLMLKLPSEVSQATNSRKPFRKMK